MFLGHQLGKTVHAFESEEDDGASSEVGGVQRILEDRWQESMHQQSE